LNRLQVEVAAGAEAGLARGELVADEEVVDDPADLLLVHQVEAAPPALELEEALGLGVDVGEEVVPLLPPRVRRIEALEVVDERRAVELAAAQVAREERGPRAAEEAARVAHRAAAVAARPVRHRRAVDDERTRDVGTCRRQHHHRPAALAVADDDGLLRVGMPLVDDADELGFGVGDVGQRLAGLRVREEDDEVDGVPRAQRDADFRIVLEAADAGAVAGARIDDDERPLARIDDDTLGRHDAHQRIVRRSLVGARIGDHLVVVVQHRRLAGRLVGEPLVAALAQRVEKEDRALHEVDLVCDGVACEVGRRLASRRRGREIGPCAAHPRVVARARIGDAALEFVGDRARDAHRAVERAVEVGHRFTAIVRCKIIASPPADRRRLTLAKSKTPRRGIAAFGRLDLRGNSSAVAHPADRVELRHRDRKLGLGGRDLLLRRPVRQRLLGLALGRERLGLVQVLAADRGVGEHRDEVGLHLEEAALHEHELLAVDVGQLHPHRAGLDLGEQRRVARIDAELAGHARQHDELRLAGEDLLFGAHHVDVNRVGHRMNPCHRAPVMPTVARVLSPHSSHRHSRESGNPAFDASSLLDPRFRGDDARSNPHFTGMTGYCIDLAFSNASSIGPTM
jgi:hypothetical protein